MLDLEHARRRYRALSLEELLCEAILNAADYREEARAMEAMFRAIDDCPKPVIMAVEGAAAGAGLSLAMAAVHLAAALGVLPWRWRTTAPGTCAAGSTA